MKIKEISSENLGIPCKWDINKCPYFKNGIDYHGTKLDCSLDYGVRCNGIKYKVIYEIDGEQYQVIENAEFSRSLLGEIDVEISKKDLIEGFKKGKTLNFILMWNSIRNEYK
ncbi:hypothetical protein ACOV1W_16435 [Paraclostridium bifermentans]|uniref:hypothetical protein n=1 Tax=Paraclostridium bifermentans TaxID=1490 RepID=UPI003D28134C